MNSKTLAMRDASAAAIFGALPDQSDFGTEFGWSEYDFGADDLDSFMFGADDVPKNPQEAIALTQKANAAIKAAKTVVQTAKARSDLAAQRERIMNPNQGSDLKVTRYIMSLTNVGAVPVFGVASAINFNDTPKVTFRPQRLIINVPAPGITFITDIQVSNISVTIGNGNTDGFNFNANGQGVQVDLPAIDPSQRASVLGNWGVYLPPTYVAGATYTLCVSIIGPAHMAGR